jgi:hypothetical protein
MIRVNEDFAGRTLCFAGADVTATRVYAVPPMRNASETISVLCSIPEKDDPHPMQFDLIVTDRAVDKRRRLVRVDYALQTISAPQAQL